MWTTIAIIFVVIIAAFLLGIYLIFRKIGNTVGKVPEQIVKEVFVIVKEKISKKDGTGI